ncbi:hypothetical protein HMPREF9056_00206 [Actinomyces sp. oral taxon 170 str. F0386]|nr:hypothetical protein HMPREF9056_00206 [Actinomyces sp. oral taxon 170 str. F0386]
MWSSSNFIGARRSGTTGVVSPFLSVAAASVRLALVFVDPVFLAVSLGSWFLPSPSSAV